MKLMCTMLNEPMACGPYAIIYQTNAEGEVLSTIHLQSKEELELRLACMNMKFGKHIPYKHCSSMNYKNYELIEDDES